MGVSHAPKKRTCRTLCPRKRWTLSRRHNHDGFQTKVVNEYCERERYICEPQHEWKEAISSVEVPYMERKALLEMLAAAKRREFDVLVVSEIRAISRRQVEVLVIYDMLQKYGVRLETVKEKFGEDAMSKAILSLRAMFTEIEVEQSKMRMMRGRADRIAIGLARIVTHTQPMATVSLILRKRSKERTFLTIPSFILMRRIINGVHIK